MKPGDRVLVSNPERGEVIATVADVHRPDQVPQLPGMPPGLAPMVRKILVEWQVERVAMLHYPSGGRVLVFAALQIGDRWWDLQKQELTLTAIVGKPA